MPESWFVQSMVKTATDMCLRGWAEGAGSSISLRLLFEDIDPFESSISARVSTAIGERIPGIGGQYFLVTGAGKHFRNFQLDPEENLGLIRISPEGESYQVLWGLRSGGTPAADLSAHLWAQDVRQRVTRGASRAIAHCHATNLIALSYVLELSSPVITRALWEGSTECMEFFPQGVGVLPWMLPGAGAIGAATAVAMKKHALVLWPHHGVLAAGATLDEAFGKIASAEKAAAVLVKVIAMGGPRQSLSTAQLRELAAHFPVTPMESAMQVEDWWKP
jgi:rhamnulose-1-phosphate aldolase